VGGATVIDVIEPSHLRTARESYDTVAEDYATLVGPLFEQEPVSRSMLAGFAELVRGPVVDVGCGRGTSPPIWRHGGWPFPAWTCRRR
jgi:hypothetical protein